MHLPKGPDRRGERENWRSLLTPLRAGRVPGACRTSECARTPVWRTQCTLRTGRRMTVELTTTPSFRLDGKLALVTGAGRGIGLAAASALADAGAHVTLAARTSKEIEEAAEAIAARSQKADWLTIDVRNVDAVKAAIDKHEPFDILVNNAGTNKPAPFVDVKVEDFDFVFSLNVRAAYFVAQAVARKLIEMKKPGSIINVASQMGHVDGPTRIVYTSTKHAIEGFTKAIAIEIAPPKDDVNT